MTDPDAAPSLATEAPDAPPVLSRLTRAYMMAALAHADQRRRGRGDIPYINHPVEVADLVAGAGAAPEVIAAAILHDVIEDSDITAAELREHFGAAVADLVEALTDAPGWEELPRSARKARQADHIGRAPPAARLIKIADQISNLGDIARDPSVWSSEDAEDYVTSSERVVSACRGTDAGLEAAFDAAAKRARAALSVPR